jgi:hypothetical protein
MLPPHIITAIQKWALVTKEKMASPLDYDPTLPQYWSEHPRDKAFGANATPSSPSSLVSLFAIPFTMKAPCI